MMTDHLRVFYSLIASVLGLVILLSIFYIMIVRKKKINNYLMRDKVNSDSSESKMRNIENYLPKVFSANKDEIKEMFTSAGYYHFNYASLYMPVKYGLALIGFGIVFIVDRSNEWLYLAAGIWMTLCILGPDKYLAEKKRKLISQISGQLPYLIDLMAMCVQTGMTIEHSLKYLSEEMSGFDKHLSHHLDQVNTQANLSGLEVALDGLYVQIPSNAMRSFVMTLKQSLHYGSSIYEILETLSSDLREVATLELEEKMGKLSTKLTIPMIVFHMFPIAPLVTVPAVMRVMSIFQ
ncbi:type II secretion system F family protein [Vibrio sp. S4M6]|uniref:type II secretion system F family protein n=1 Tax=Vibrio sinus TaxID=2946865 RepID=UPI00202A04FC|nr:type II secretion system F family protein [Vibrio sinus]MCL9783354.1 type II secretion system F family protein [Vibrio sinus]